MSDRIVNKITISGLRVARESGRPSPLPVPELLSPINGKQFPPYPRILNLSWKAVPGATGYIVNIQFGKNWLSKPPINVTSTFLTTDFPANVPGRWCVSAVDNTGLYSPSPNSQWSNFDFTVQILETPKLISPINGQTFSNYPRTTTLTWQPVANATGYVVTVDACQDRQITSTSIWQNTRKLIVQATSYTFDFIGAQPGRWCVFAIDSTNNHQQSAVSPLNIFIYTV